MANLLRIPEYETIKDKTYNFSDFQNEILYSTFSEVKENVSLNEDMEVMTLNIIKYYLNKFTRNDVEVVIIYYEYNNRILYCASYEVGLFVTLLGSYIITNLSQFGIFTQYWDNLNDYLVAHFINYIDDMPNVEQENLENILEETFESNRKEVIEKTFEHNNHEIKISSETVDISTDNQDCKLCYDKSDYQCSKCGYSICKQCVEKIKHSTGKCPCCQVYPLILKVIK